MGGSYAQAGVSAVTARKEHDLIKDIADNEAFAKLQAEQRYYDNLFELFEGPKFARGLLSGIEGRGGAQKILQALFAKPVPLTAAEKAEYNRFLTSQPLADETQGLLEGLRPHIDELVSTGFRTDISPIVDAEQHRLMTETAPGLAERFGGAISTSGFENALAQSGEDLGLYLGSQQVGLDEAAAGRRSAGLNAAPGLLASPLNLRTGFAEALGAAGERYRLRKESTRPNVAIGNRLLAALGPLAGIEGQQGFMFGGFPSNAGTPGAGGAGLGNLAGLLGGVGDLVTDLYGAYQGRNTVNAEGTPFTTYGTSQGYGGFGNDQSYFDTGGFGSSYGSNNYSDLLGGSSYSVGGYEPSSAGTLFSGGGGGGYNYSSAGRPTGNSITGF